MIELAGAFCNWQVEYLVDIKVMCGICRLLCNPILKT